MAKSTPVSTDEFSALTRDADEFAHRLAAIQSRLEKHFEGDCPLDLVTTLNRLAEQSCAVNRMLVTRRQMHDQAAALETRLRRKAT